MAIDPPLCGHGFFVGETLDECPECSADESQLRVTRWRRYGKDRLYVKDPSDRTVGWVDVITGARHIKDPSQSGAFEVAVADRPELQHASLPYAQVEDRPETKTRLHNPHAPLAHDLAENTPGQAIRTQAIAAREAAPVKTVVARVLGVHTKERAWRIGTKGEEKVGAQLRKLDPTVWKVLHSIPVGSNGSDIDHVVIGPGGVFTLNAKHHPDKSVWVGGDTFMVNGHRQPYVRNARHEAARAGKRLTEATGIPVEATGLVVVIGARGMTVRSQPDDGRVFIVARRQIVRWLKAQPTRLTAEVVERIYAQARSSQTWS